MSTLPRQAIRSIRTLHTTSRILSDTPPPKSLGFGDYTGRTRSLPTIDIPASSRLNVGGRKNKPDSESKPNTNPKVAAKSGPRQAGGAPGSRKFPEKREKRTSKSPLVQTSKSLEAAEKEGEGNDEFFTMSGDSTGTGSSSRKQMDTVDIDFSPERLSSLKPRTKTRNGNGKGKGGVAAGSTSSSKTGSKRDTKGGKSTGSEPAKREDDRSSEGIFGRVSLLFPLRRGARLAEQSIWAEGMKSEDARKAELERLIGKPTAYLPDVAYPTNLARSGKKAARDSKDMASWIMATNPGISMRREKTGQAVLETYLK